MKKILIADNKKDVRDMLKIVFRLSGYKKIYYAKNSHSCIRKIKRVNPDLITTKFKPLELIDKVENCIGSNEINKINNSELEFSFLPRSFSPVLYSETI